MQQNDHPFKKTLTALVKLILTPGVLSRVVILAVSLLLAALNSCCPKFTLPIVVAAVGTATEETGAATVVAEVVAVALVVGGCKKEGSRYSG